MDKRQLLEFIKFPLKLHRDDPLFTPELTTDLKKHFSPHKNPFFRNADVRYFLAYSGGKCVGRIASILNRRHIEFHNDSAGFFGFFDSINNKAVAAVLLETVAGQLKSCGLTIMRGPMNFSTNDECGFVVDGFQYAPVLMTPHNPPYYIDLMQSCGMGKSKDLYAYITDIPKVLPEKIDRVAQIAEKNGVCVKKVDKRRFDEGLEKFKEVYNDAWEKNWGFIPLTEDELLYLGKRLKQVIEPDTALIAEKDGEPIGFLGLIPDLNIVLRKMKGKLNPVTVLKALYYSRKITTTRMLLLGIKARYRNRGVDALLYREGFKGCLKHGFTSVEFSWILEDNLPTQMLVKMIGGTHYKTFRIFERVI
ncbi:MAG: N-acetyltransferase [Nitrospirae bacterium YQR-1]